MGQATLVHEGNIIDHTPAGNIAAGEVVIQSNVVGFAARAILATVLGSLQIAGVVDFVHIADVLAIGAAAYWDAAGNPYGGTPGSGAATATSGGNTFIGWVVVAAGNTDALVRVKLSGSPAVTVNHYGPLNNPVADPGDAGAIAITGSGYVTLVSAGAETRTLAAPASIALELLIYSKTAVGTITITCATTVNEAANNTIVFTNTGESLRLVAVEEGATLRWRVVSIDGAVLSTV